MVAKSSTLYPRNLLSRAKALYESGIGVAGVAEKLGVGRNGLRRAFIDAGIKLRTAGEQQTARMARATPAERRRLAKAAQDAVRGRHVPMSERMQRAVTREARQTHVSRYERRVAAELRKRGLSPATQKAIGPYNCDVAMHPVAVEIFGGHWHWSGDHLAGAEKRLRYLFDAGWHVLMIVVEPRATIGVVCDEIVAYCEQASRDPASCRQYRVIRSTGQLIADGSAQDNKLTIKSAFDCARDAVTGRYKRVGRKAVHV